MPDLLITPQHKDVLSLDGPISSDEGAHLAYLASQIPQGGTVVEIGTNEGKSASFIAFGLRHAGNITAKVHCVDLWSLGGPTQQHNYRDPHKQAKFEANRDRLGLNGVLIAHRAESTQFAKTWTEAIDLLFIDAGHTYEALHADYDAWNGFVPVGGFIAFHDYMDMWPGVKRVLDEEVFPDLRWRHWQTVYRLKSARRVEHVAV